MPKTSLVQIECEWCGNHDTINISDPAEKVLPVIAKWKGVIDGDAPPEPGADNHRWYDSSQCLVSGENRHEAERIRQSQEQSERDQQLAKANEALKSSGFMKKAAEAAKA